MRAESIQRIGNCFYARKMKAFSKFLDYLNLLLHNSYSPLSVEVGSGTKTAYGGIGIVIHARAKIGKHCLLGQGIIIGGKNGQSGVPVVEDNVYVGPGVRIIGDIVNTLKNFECEIYVKYVGVVRGEEKDKLYRSADVFVSASRAERFGLNIVEAMGYALCVISTPVGVAREIIESRENGYQIRIDDIIDLVKKMNTVLSDKSSLERISRKSKEVTKRFSWETVLKEIVEIY